MVSGWTNTKTPKPQEKAKSHCFLAWHQEVFYIMEGSRPAATLTLWGKRFFLSSEKASLPSPFRIWSIWSYHDQDHVMWLKASGQGQDGTLGQTGEGPVLRWVICNHNEFILQTSLKTSLQLWNDTKLKTGLSMPLKRQEQRRETLFTRRTKPKLRIYCHKSQARLQRCCSSGLGFFPLDSFCPGTAGRRYFALMVIKNKVPKRGLSLRKTEGRASVKNPTTAAV